MGKIFKGIIITSREDKGLDIYKSGFMAVSDKGVIEEICDTDICSKYSSYELKDFSNHLIIPGFVDTHNHLPQYAFAGLGDGQLLQWLQNYTFPREAEFSKEEVAQKASEIFFKDLIKNGTTTSVSFSTIHKNATDIAFECAEKIGIRAVIGKVMMDQNSPSFLNEDTQKSLDESEELIQKWHKKNNLLFYALMPRFAITCSFDLLKQAAKLQNKYDVYLQTHLAENLGELEKVKEIFPKFKSYLDVYEQAGILSSKSLMVHCIYLNDQELDTLKKTKTKVVHSPTSNRFLSSGIMNFRKYLDLGLDISLGTDVAGGYSLSMFNEIKEAIESSKANRCSHGSTLRYILQSKTLRASEPRTNKKNKLTVRPEPVEGYERSISLQEAFYAATLGGAKNLSLQDVTGSLEKNKSADFLIIDPKVVDPMRGDSAYQEPIQMLSRCIHRSDNSMIKKVYVCGKKLI